MEKLKSLESIGFSNEFLERIKEFDKNSPQVSHIDISDTFVKISNNFQNINITSDPKTAYSNVIVKG
ncbi:hypothetical protein [Pedobacter panaciterrae]|uniref:hypothetical protein n=1 Tax=Pedobacter panaciterrae TaxID=363849 RepID=UPI00259951E5|nr:hypothetical protein [uncultured Pedobacter sp.]